MPDPHTGFVVTAFAIGALVIAGCVLAIVIDHARLRATLARLEAQVPARAGDEGDRS